MDDTTHPTPEPRDGLRDRLPVILVITVAALLQAIVLVPFTLASGLVAPLPGVIAAHLLGLASVVVLVRVARRRPLLSPLVPLTNAALLWTMLTLGDVLLGWTA